MEAKICFFFNTDELMQEVSSKESKYIDTIADSLKSDINKMTNIDDYINEIRVAYEKEKIVFVLGAGVGVDYNLPDWNTLLQKILLNTFSQENSKGVADVYATLFTNCFNSNNLISARYLSEQTKNDKINMEALVSDALYQNIVKDEESKLVEEIIQYCVAPGKSPNLDSIITYNYDDIIEKALDKCSVDIPYKSIYKVGMTNENEELPIYHVHGYLPRDAKNDDWDCRITLGEDSYHEQYNDTYSWNNIVQINKFREKNCIFIGISFSDPNLRRLLDIAMKQCGDEKNRHYLFKKRYQKEDIESTLKKIISESEKIQNTKREENINLSDISERLISTMESFEERDADSFGVNIIWIDDYKEIPKILNKIRKI